MATSTVHVAKDQWHLAWLATYVFLAKKGITLEADDDRAYDLVIAVATGLMDDVEEIAAVLATFTA